MKMLNNKGQSLVLFIIFIPVLLGIMALVIDVGNALGKKRELDNVIEFVLDYGLKTSEVLLENNDKEYYNEELVNWKDNLKILLNYNLKDCDNDIFIEDKEIVIVSKTYVEGVYSNILNIDGFLVEGEYRGYISDNSEFVIEKVK